MAEPGGAAPNIGPDTAVSAAAPDNPFAGQVKLATPTNRQAAHTGSGAFLIDSEHAERFISDIRAAADKLHKTRETAKSARWHCSPEADPISRNLARQAELMSDNAATAIDRYRVALEKVASALEADLSAYQQAEQANTMRRQL